MRKIFILFAAAAALTLSAATAGRTRVPNSTATAARNSITTPVDTHYCVDGGCRAIAIGGGLRRRWHRNHRRDCNTRMRAAAMAAARATSWGTT